MGTVFLERMRACGPEDAIRLELFSYNSKTILNRMIGLKELYIMDYPESGGLPKPILTLILKKCLGLEYLCVLTEVLELIPENELSLKYLCGCLRIKLLLSIMEKSPSLEGLEIDFYRDRVPHYNQEFEELHNAVLPILLKKLPFGLKWFKNELNGENLSSLFSSDELIEILCRNNRDLQSIEIEYGGGLTAVSMTHLATLEHLTNIRFCNSHYDLFFTPTSLLSSLRNRASRPKHLELFFSLIDSQDLQIINLKREIERQKLEDGSLISVWYTDRNDCQVLV